MSKSEIVGYLISIPVIDKDNTFDTDVYCINCAKDLLPHWNHVNINMDAAVTQNEQCGICKVKIAIVYCEHIKEQCKKLVQDAFVLLRNNPLGTCHDRGSYSNWIAQERRWKQQATELTGWKE